MQQTRSLSEFSCLSEHTRLYPTLPWSYWWSPKSSENDIHNAMPTSAVCCNLNSLDKDQARQNVWPDQDSNCLTNGYGDMVPDGQTADAITLFLSLPQRTMKLKTNPS